MKLWALALLVGAAARPLFVAPPVGLCGRRALAPGRASAASVSTLHARKPKGVADAPARTEAGRGRAQRTSNSSHRAPAARRLGSRSGPAPLRASSHQEHPEPALSRLRRWLSELDLPDGLPRTREGIIDDLKFYGATIAVTVVLRLAIVEPRYIPSLSMYPTFEIGDQCAVEKVSKWTRPPRRSEVLVFRPPENLRIMTSAPGGSAPDPSYPSMPSLQAALIKRVVAVAGDTVEVREGVLYVNGEAQREDYVIERPSYAYGPSIVPEGCVFVLGDNRNRSLDSHIWGPLPIDTVIGRAVFRYWPVWRAGGVQ